MVLKITILSSYDLFCHHFIEFETLGLDDKISGFSNICHLTVIFNSIKQLINNKNIIQVLGSRCEEENFNLRNDESRKEIYNIFTRVWIFTIFSKEKNVFSSPGELTTIELEASPFKVRPNELLYDLSSQNYVSLNYSQLFIVTDTITLFAVRSERCLGVVDGGVCQSSLVLVVSASSLCVSRLKSPVVVTVDGENGRRIRQSWNRPLVLTSK